MSEMRAPMLLGQCMISVHGGVHGPIVTDASSPSLPSPPPPPHDGCAGEGRRAGEAAADGGESLEEQGAATAAQHGMVRS